MARSDCAMAEDWSWRELLGADLLLSPRAPTPPAAATSAITTTPPCLAPDSTGSGTIHPSDCMRGVPAMPPLPSLDDLVWQWDEGSELINMDVDTLYNSVGLGTPAHEQDEASRPANTRSGTHLAKKTKSAKVRDAPAKRPRMRRKVEIALLRDESQKLQQKLLQLREYWKQAPARAAANSTQQELHATSESLTEMEPMWKQISLRQRDAAAESEKQNNALKAKFQEQRKVLKTLRTLLIKRVALMKAFQEQYNVMVVPPNPRFVQIGCASSFRTLLDDSTSMFKESGRVLHLVQVRGNREQHGFRGWKCVYDDLKDLLLEAVDSFAVPFSRDDTERAIRQIYRADWSPKDQINEYLNSSEDTIIRQFISSFNTHAGAGDVRVRQTLRRFVDGPRTILVANRTIERLEGDSKHGSELRERKWMVLCSRDGANGSPVTTIHMYSTMKPEKMPAAYKTLWCEQMLRATLIPILDRGNVRLRHRVETLLIEEGIKNRKAAAEQPIVV